MIKCIDLSGVFKFDLDPDKSGIDNQIYTKELSDTITLPGTTSMAKKGEYSDRKEIGTLTDPYLYEGYAWYQKEIELDDSYRDKIVQLHLERTRLTKVWVDTTYVGEYDSLTTPHNYDLTPYIKDRSFRLTILVSNVDYPTKGGHLTSPDTQTNWNGITGEISLRIYNQIYIENVKVFSDVEKKQLKLSLTTVNNTTAPVTYRTKLSLSPITYNETFDISTSSSIDETELNVAFPVGRNKCEYIYNCPNMELWSEYNTVTYDLCIITTETCEQIHTICGLRSFTTTETEFLINGEKTFLRGKHDGLIFPMTGAAPTTVAEWLKVMSISKSYGINHYRYHTCCPPEAAFTAADLLGIYMEPQLPFWGTLTSPADENHNAAEQDYLIEEGYRMMEAYGNHPSFCMMSLGNELWGSAERMNEIIKAYKELDRRHLYTQGSNNFQHTPLIIPEDDFFVGVRLSKNRLIRGSYGMCDAPLGHLQWEEPATNMCYDDAISGKSEAILSDNGDDTIEIQYGTGVKKVKAAKTEDILVPHIPVVTHEIGQYAVYPNFKEIDKYTGVLKARNFEVFKDRLEEKGMLDQAEDFFYTSGKLSVACYKEELEAAARSSLVAGYQILDIQDFTGQGTALVGILDAFMDSKGHVTPEEWSGYCSDGILLASFDRYIYTAGEAMNAKIGIRYYNPVPLKDTNLHYELSRITSYDTYNLTRACVSGDITIPDNARGLVWLGEVSIAIPDTDTSCAYQLTLTVPGTAMKNVYEIYAYPNIDSDSQITEAINSANNTDSYELKTGEYPVTICNNIDALKLALAQNKRILFMPNTLKEYIEGFYCTDFWCYPMFRDICEWMKKPVAVGTMGLMIDSEHKAVKHMLSHKYSTPQWYQLVTHASCAILDDVTDKDYRPILQMVDNFERNHKLGILFEGNVKDAKLMVCTIRLNEISDRPEVKQFIASLLSYMSSEAFKPDKELDITKLETIF